MQAPYITLEQTEAFWSRVRKRKKGCWIWTGAPHKKGGYGRMRIGSPSRITYAHRVSWILHHKSAIPKEKPYILHSCDNGLCVRPSHLRAGTPVENTSDMLRRHRQLKGVDCHAAKLTDAKVRAIHRHFRAYKKKYGWMKSSGLSRVRGAKNTRTRFYEEEAKRYGVHTATIADVVNDKTWTHV